jgi:hypothetical protein
MSELHKTPFRIFLLTFEKIHEVCTCIINVMIMYTYYQNFSNMKKLPKIKIGVENMQRRSKRELFFL